MGLFHFFTKLNINTGVQAFRQNPNAVLLDVRTEAEYAEGRIEGSINVPLQTLEKIQEKVADKNVLLYVHCRSGARSAKAVTLLKKMGYVNAIDIGGILGYSEETKKG